MGVDSEATVAEFAGRLDEVLEGGHFAARRGQP